MKMRLFIGIVALVMVNAQTLWAEPDIFPFAGVVNADTVNIRAGQSRSFEVLGELKKGAQAVVVQKSYSWYKIKLPNHARCYVYRKLVTFLRDQIGEVKGNSVNIRARADLNAAIIGQLNDMTKVKIVETLDEWYRIEPVEGIYGWVREDLIDFQSRNVPPPVMVQLPTRNVYAIKRQQEEELKAAEAKRLAEEQARKITIKGTVVLLKSPSPASDVRHQITGDEGKVFYLMGYRSVLDGFLNHRVQIEGLPQEEITGDHPVLLVTRVALVL